MHRYAIINKKKSNTGMSIVNNRSLLEHKVVRDLFSKRMLSRVLILLERRTVINIVIIIYCFVISVPVKKYANCCIVNVSQSKEIYITKSSKFFSQL